MSKIQVMGENGICSSVGDIEKHEKFKKLSMDERIAKLQEVYDKYGVYSEEFFIQVKPFIMWTAYRYMRGMHYSCLEDLVNNAYEELVIAFAGGWTTYYNNPKKMEPEYGTEEYYNKYANIGTFVMAKVGSSVAKYRSRNYKKIVSHVDQDHDISDKLNFTNFEMDNDLGYEIKDPEMEEKLFDKFTLSPELEQHIRMLVATQPRNNVFYNYVLWKNREEE